MAVDLKHIHSITNLHIVCNTYKLEQKIIKCYKNIDINNVKYNINLAISDKRNYFILLR